MTSVVSQEHKWEGIFFIKGGGGLFRIDINLDYRFGQIIIVDQINPLLEKINWPVLMK